MVWEAVGGFSAGLAKCRTFPLGCCGKDRLGVGWPGVAVKRMGGQCRKDPGGNGG